ncbi:MAG: riboflavin biosynthesis protein RibF [Firmicutes bacterium]|nr:riboflavin biosynthesis protein RibF [Bacillota bacterium]
MKIWNSILKARQEISKSPKSSVVTIGNFDGVHRGHQIILQRTIANARRLGGLAIALTFSNHTESLLGEAPLLLNQPLIRRELLAGQGLDALLEVEFSENFAGLEPDIFFRTWLIEGLNCKAIVIGHDFRFGSTGRGDYELLAQMATEKGIILEKIDPIVAAGQIISSSKIRQLLAEGRLELANQMLGYNFLIEGEVIEGEQLGRKLGYPTANLRLPSEYLLPCYGVYLVRLFVNDQYYFGIANVGIKPTFGKYRPLVEIYLFEVELDLYHKILRVEFLRFIRPENRFAGPEALRAQIARDVETAQGLLKELMESESK